MKNFKDKTIARLCNLLNCFEDLGFLTYEDRGEYRCIMDDYSEGCYEERKIEEAAVEPKRYSNCVIYRDKEDGEVIVEAYPDDRADDMMRDVSKVICFSDCDDIVEVLHIVYNGREVEYVGWQPGMKYEYKFVATGDIAWCAWHPEWDH